MQTKDNLNYFMTPGTAYVAVSIDEILTPDLFVREMYESPMYSESGGWDKTYKSEKWQGTAWHKVEDELPGWIGKTYRDLMNFGGKQGAVGHEIVRVTE